MGNVRGDPAARHEGGGNGDFDNVAPRLAVNYRPDARSSLRFGAGLFHGKLSYAVISDALQRNTTSAGLRSQLSALQARGIIAPGIPLDPLTFDGNLSVSPPCATASAASVMPPYTHSSAAHAWSHKGTNGFTSKWEVAGK